jgi:hypothetical protein
MRRARRPSQADERSLARRAATDCAMQLGGILDQVPLATVWLIKTSRCNRERGVA